MEKDLHRDGEHAKRRKCQIERRMLPHDRGAQAVDQILRYGSLCGVSFGSGISAQAASPVSVTAPPKMAKNFRHSPRCVMPSNAPKITSMAMSGKTASTDSVFPRFPNRSHQ